MAPKTGLGTSKISNILNQPPLLGPDTGSHVVGLPLNWGEADV